MKADREMNLYVYISALFLLAMYATFGLIVVLEISYRTTENWEQLFLTFNPVQMLVFQLLTAAIIVLVFSFFYALTFFKAWKYDGTFNWAVSGVAYFMVSLLVLYSVFLGGVMAVNAFASPLIELEVLDFFRDPGTIRMISILSFAGISVGFVELIIGATSLGYYRSSNEDKRRYVFRNLLFVFCAGTQFSFFIFKQQITAFDVRWIQLVSFFLFTYEFFSALERSSDLYDAVSQTIRVPTAVVRFAQAVIIAFMSFLFEIINIYTYSILLPFWILAIASSTRQLKIPAWIKAFTGFSDRAPKEKIFENLHDNKRKILISAKFNLYSAFLTGVCTDLLLLLNKALIKSIPFFYMVFILTVPMFFGIRIVLQRVT